MANEAIEMVQLSDGTTIRDVYAAFRDGLSGEGPFRTEDELRHVIHSADLRYDECSRLSVSQAWALCFSDEAIYEVEAEESAPKPAAWEYDGYWNAVLGAGRSASDVVHEFDLSAKGLDEWLGTAESEAAAMGRLGGVPEAWHAFHGRALAALEAAVSA